MNLAIKVINGKEGIVKMRQLRRLVSLVPKRRNVRMVEQTDDVPAQGIVHAAIAGKALKFLADPREEVYSTRDAKIRYK